MFSLLSCNIFFHFYLPFFLEYASTYIYDTAFMNSCLFTPFTYRDKKVHQTICKAIPGLRQQKTTMKSQTGLQCHPKDSTVLRQTDPQNPHRTWRRRDRCLLTKLEGMSTEDENVKSVSWWPVSCADKAAFLTLKSCRARPFVWCWDVRII